MDVRVGSRSATVAVTRRMGLEWRREEKIVGLIEFMGKVRRVRILFGGN